MIEKDETPSPVAEPERELERETEAAVAAHPEDAGDGKKPVEVWAQDNQLTEVLAPEGGMPRENPHYWKFTAAKALRKWQDGELVTEEEFDNAIAEVANPIIR